MKTVLIFIILPGVMLIASFIILGIISHSGTAPGLTDGQLTPCPKKPNCVCSEYPENQAAFIAPIYLPDGDLRVISGIIEDAIKAIGGTVKQADNHYLAAVFTSSLFGFTDDLELRIDPEARLLHLRSASRVGHSDMGVNRKRVERLRKRLLSAIER